MSSKNENTTEADEAAQIALILDGIVDGIGVMSHYELAYSLYSYSMLLLNSVLSAASIWYLCSARLRRKEQPAFRPVAIYGVVICWALIASMTLAQPVTLEPLAAGYCAGVMKYLGPNGLLIVMWITWTCIGQLSLVYTLGFLFQYAQMQVMRSTRVTRALDWFNTSRRVWCVLNGLLVGQALLFLVPFFIFRLNLTDPREMEQFREFASRNPSMMIIAANEANSTSIFVSSIIMMIIFVEIILSLLANVLTLLAIRATRDLVNRRTRKLQMTVYRLFSLQVLVIFLFLYAPIILSAVGKSYMRDPIVAAPLMVAALCLCCPAQFLINAIHFAQIRRHLNSSIEPTTFSISQQKQSKS